MPGTQNPMRAKLGSTFQGLDQRLKALENWTQQQAPKLLQLVIPGNWQACFGVISSTGTVLTGLNVATVTHPSTGVYTVAFSSPLAASTPIVVVSPQSAAAPAFETSAVTNTGFTATFYVSSTGAVVNTQWHFIAIG